MMSDPDETPLQVKRLCEHRIKNLEHEHRNHDNRLKDVESELSDGRVLFQKLTGQLEALTDTVKDIKKALIWAIILIVGTVLLAGLRLIIPGA